MTGPTWTTDHAKALGRRIAAARKAAGWSLQRVADALEVERATVGHWETGARTIKVHDLWALCTALGVSADKLLFDVEKWPFEKISYDAVKQLEVEDLHRIEGGVLLIAAQIGVELEKPRVAAA